MSDTPKCDIGARHHKDCLLGVKPCPVSPETQGLDFEAAYATATQRLFDAEQAKLLARKWLKQDLTLAQVFDALQAQRRALVAAAVQQEREDSARVWSAKVVEAALGVERDVRAEYAPLIEKVGRWEEAMSRFHGTIGSPKSTKEECEAAQDAFTDAEEALEELYVRHFSSHPLPEEGQ